jgi:hypothetical protein
MGRQGESFFYLENEQFDAQQESNGHGPPHPGICARIAVLTAHFW